jgi:hypothetical protein
MAKGTVRVIKDGYLVPFWLTNNTPLPHDVLMSAKTFSQPITHTNQVVARRIPTTYILTVEVGKTPELGIILSLLPAGRGAWFEHAHHGK